MMEGDNISLIIYNGIKKQFMTNITKQDSQKKKEAYALTIGSSVASMIAKFVVHPIDTIKAKVQVNRMKVQNLSDVQVGSAIALTKQTIKNEGIAGLFRGVTISVLGGAVAFSLYITAYERAKEFLSQKKFFQNYPSFAHLFAGFCAEIGSCLVWLPIDIIKERLQVQSQVKIYTYKGPIQAMKKINASEGLIGLYRAFGATLTFFGPFSALFFVVYQKMKDWVLKDRQHPSLFQSILCSSAAGTVAGWLTNPLELVKLRMQIQRADVGMRGGSLENSIFGYRNIFHGLYLLAKNEGFYALYKGAMLRVFFTVPITTLSMSLTQLFKDELMKSSALESFI